jgi:hypothetical protein
MTFPTSLYINICKNIDMYITYTPKVKKRNGKWDSPRSWRHRTGQVLDPGSGSGGMFLQLMLQNETGHRQDILS